MGFEDNPEIKAQQQTERERIAAQMARNDQEKSVELKGGQYEMTEQRERAIGAAAQEAGLRQERVIEIMKSMSADKIETGYPMYTLEDRGHTMTFCWKNPNEKEWTFDGRVVEDPESIQRLDGKYHPVIRAYETVSKLTKENPAFLKAEIDALTNPED